MAGEPRILGDFPPEQFHAMLQAFQAGRNSVSANLSQPVEVTYTSTGQVATVALGVLLLLRHGVPTERDIALSTGQWSSPPASAEGG